jgi:hypothetical protein
VLTGAHVDRAWNLLLSSGDDSSSFFDFLRSVLGSQEWCRTNSNLVCQLFREKIMEKSDVLFTKGIQLSGF